MTNTITENGCLRPVRLTVILLVVFISILTIMYIGGSIRIVPSVHEENDIPDDPVYKAFMEFVESSITYYRNHMIGHVVDVSFDMVFDNYTLKIYYFRGGGEYINATLYKGRLVVATYTYEKLGETKVFIGRTGKVYYSGELCMFVENYVDSDIAICPSVYNWNFTG